MKYETAEPEFRPVTITLESQEEVDLLHAAIAMHPGTHANNMLFELYCKLDKVSNSQFSDYWHKDGLILLKK